MILAAEHPDLQILFVSYNNPTALFHAVDSILAYGLEAQAITILENGSSPDIKEYILSEAQSKGINVFDSSINRGWGASINHYISSVYLDALASEILLVMAHDACFTKLDLNEIKFYFQDPNAIFVCPAYPYPLQCHYNILKSYFTKPGMKKGLIKIGHQTACFTRPALLKKIKYDEECWIYGDELNVFTRANKVGYRSYQATNTVVVNPASDSSAEFSTLVYQLNFLYISFSRHGFVGLYLRSAVNLITIFRLLFMGNLDLGRKQFCVLRFALMHPGCGYRSYRSNPSYQARYKIFSQ